MATSFQPSQEQEPRSQKRRNSAKPSQKKQPQRGLGVAQLEKLIKPQPPLQHMLQLPIAYFDPNNPPPLGFYTSEHQGPWVRTHQDQYQELSSTPRVVCVYNHCDICSKPKKKCMNDEISVGLSLGYSTAMDEGVKVKKRERALMEYEFFPLHPNNNKDTSGSLGGGGGEASASSPAAATSTSFLDLSLNLTCYK